MIPIPLKEDLEKELMKMPELEQEEEYRNNVPDYQEEEYDEIGACQPEVEHKAMNTINTFQAHENEVYLRGTDEYGKDFQICFDSYNFLEWIDTEHLKYIKEQLKKYIESK